MSVEAHDLPRGKYQGRRSHIKAFGIAAGLAIPALAYVLAFFVPILYLLRTSFNSFSSLTGMIRTWTLENFETALFDEYFVQIWLRTIRISATAAALTVIIGFVVAYALWRSTRRIRTIMTAAVVAPLFVSAVVRVYGWQATTGPSGLIPNALDWLGLPKLTLFATPAAVIVALVHITLAYAVLMIVAALDGVNPNCLRAAASIGAGPLRAVWTVVLPQVATSLVSAFAVCFAVSSASYAIPAVVGGGRVPTAGTEIYAQQASFANLPLACALSVSLVLIAAGALAATYLINGLIRRTFLGRSDLQ